MKTSDWKGLVTAASQFSLPPGVMRVQNNLQIRNLGELTPRPGLTPKYTTYGETYEAVYRQSRGPNEFDILYSFRPSANLTDESGDTASGYRLFRRFRVDAGPLTSSVDLSVYSTTQTPQGRPSFCEDRHGSIYVFFGNDIPPITIVDNTAQAVPMGLAAPTVAPTVTPSGDGWFIERVDVVNSGTSYYTPPKITVSGGDPDRPAKLKAVVQGGSIVAIDIVDGGSNYREVPEIAVSDEQLGVGFSAIGNLEQSPAVYGFRESDGGQLSNDFNGSYSAGSTHGFHDPGQAPQIAYREGLTTFGVDVSFSPVTGVYTALIPLHYEANNAVVQTDAFAQFKFAPLSASYKTGNVDPAGFATDSVFTTNIINTATPVKFGYKRSGWYTSNDYFENTYTPPINNIPTRFTYMWYANRDKFWGLGASAYNYIFAKSQQITIGVTPDDWLGNNRAIRIAGDYYFPDYTYISYYALTGPENGLTNFSNWTVKNALVQFDDNDRPYADITMEPARKVDGSAYALEAESQLPVIRIYLAPCPESWTLGSHKIDEEKYTDGRPDLTLGIAWGNRYTPQSGQDRRLLTTDTVRNDNGDNLYQLSSTVQDSYTRWWGKGHVGTDQPNGYNLAQPIVDFRDAANNDTIGIAAGTIEVINPGSFLEKGAKFAIRFYQFNAAGYTVVDRGGRLDSTWIFGVTGSRKYFRNAAGWFNEVRGGTDVEASYTDFYLQAEEVDTAGTAGSLLMPGAVITSPAEDAPKVVISGSGWTAANEVGYVRLRQKAPPFLTDPNAVGNGFTNSDVWKFTTVQLAASVAGERIGSVTILSGGRDYYREPQILFRGGSGYGLRLGATVSGGTVTSVAILDGGDGFASDTVLYTDVTPAKLIPVLRGTMQGSYECAYRFADYSRTVVSRPTYTTSNPLDNSRRITVSDATGIKPGMQITDAENIEHMARIKSVQGNILTLERPLLSPGTDKPCTIRDMTRPVTYSDLSPFASVEADANGSGRASRLNWTLDGVIPPSRADYVEFFRTSADQSLVYYRTDVYGEINDGNITISNGGRDELSDEELFDPNRSNYAALPVVLPNGAVNAFRFGIPRSDMGVAVAWQDRLWYGVSSSGKDANTIFFSEYDEFESCPDVNELPIQTNLRATDYLTALVPFGHLLLAMQNSHCYSLTYNTDPSIDATINLVAHRGALSQNAWDIYDDLLYAVDERGVYSMTPGGAIETLSEPIRNFFDDNLLQLQYRDAFFLKVDAQSAILRVFVVTNDTTREYPDLALCYHIRNKVWWTETYPTALTCATDFRDELEPDKTLYASIDGHLHRLEGLRDTAFRDIVQVVVQYGGSGYVDPPAVSVSTLNGSGTAKFQAIVRKGKVTQIQIIDGGYGYGGIDIFGVFIANEPLIIEPSPTGNPADNALGYSVARVPSTLEQQGNPPAEVVVYSRATVPWTLRTGSMELNNDGNTRGGDSQQDRSVSVAYRPTETSTTLILREYYNNDTSPRPNAMRRDRGTGFVHDANSSQTTLDMVSSRTPFGPATGVAMARFAGRSLTDMSSSDRHIAIELSSQARSADADDLAPSKTVLYGLEVEGVDANS